MDDRVTYRDDNSSMPRLRVRAKRLFKLFWIAGLSPLILLIVLAVMPESVLMALGRLFNELLWVHFKYVQLDGCTKCHMMTYSLVAIPISWLAALIAGIWSIPLRRDSLWQAG